MDHYIRYVNLASTLDPPMTDIDLLSVLTSHFEPRIQQGLICGNFQNTKDTLTFLAKYQGLGDNTDNFRSSRQDYNRRDVSRKTQENPNRDERQRDRGNNVNVRYIRRQTHQRGGRYNSDYRINQGGLNYNGRAQGRIEENDKSRLNPTAPRFDTRERGTPAGRNTGRGNTQDLNN
jgi:hypothetical protein